VVGGLQTIDGGKADDKIIAVLENDNFWGDVTDISELPNRLIERLEHYFGTYKMLPGTKSRVSVEKVYDRRHAHKVVEAAIEDYKRECADALRDK
jgi:inorganic pyrophosphatase